MADRITAVNAAIHAILNADAQGVRWRRSNEDADGGGTRNSSEPSRAETLMDAIEERIAWMTRLAA